MKPPLTFAFLALFAAPAAFAATIIVDSTQDENAASFPNGTCTLREAIIAANSNVAVDGCGAGTEGLDTIILPAGTYRIEIPEPSPSSADEDAAANGDLDILEDLRLVGDGADVTVIDGGGESGVRTRVMETIEVEVEIRGVTLTRGVGTGGVSTHAAGGALYAFKGHVHLIDSVVSASTSTYPGGGLYGSLSSIELTRSTVHGCSASSAGGGIAVVNTDLALIDSTVSGNVSGHHGGGLVLACNSCATQPTVMLLSSTIADNTALFGSAMFLDNGVRPTVGNSILEGSCTGGPVSLGGNLESPGDSCRLAEATDQVNVPHAGLEALAHAGGPTPTQALRADSPAIDAGLGPSCSSYDQRGLARVDGACDVGAFELGAIPCVDDDGDGFFVDGGACGPVDCDDVDPFVNPGAVEVCNGIDDNCQNEIDEGFDLDGDGWTVCAGDCADADPAVNPGALEVCNGIDDDCAGGVDEGFDEDVDGWTTCAGDCDDTNWSVHPGRVEIPGNGLDDDCDSATPGGCQPELAEASAASGDQDGGLPLDLALFMVLLAASSRRWRRGRSGIG